jgi:hypothetical protein
MRAMPIKLKDFSKVFYFNETGCMFGQIDDIEDLIKKIICY